MSEQPTTFSPEQDRSSDATMFASGDEIHTHLAGDNVISYAELLARRDETTKARQQVADSEQVPTQPEISVQGAMTALNNLKLVRNYKLEEVA